MSCYSVQKQYFVYYLCYMCTSVGLVLGILFSLTTMTQVFPLGLVTSSHHLFFWGQICTKQQKFFVLSCLESPQILKDTLDKNK